MNAEEKLDAARRALARLDGHVVLVEGARDERALRELGVRAPALAAVGKPERVVARAKASGLPAALLFDFDGEGERKTRDFAGRLRDEGVRVDLLARKRLGAALGLRTVEEAAAVYARLACEAGENEDTR